MGPKTTEQFCLNCGGKKARRTYTYCSNKCQADMKYQRYISQWKLGEVSGMQGRLGIVSRHVKRYLREKYNNCCCICGWSEVNIVTQQVPLVADHIDGNWQNNLESNLRLICPNCDSISATYGNLNRGKGRLLRKVSKRVLTARTLSKNMPM